MYILYIITMPSRCHFLHMLPLNVDVKKVFAARLFLCLPRASLSLSFSSCSPLYLLPELTCCHRLWSVDNFPLHLCSVRPVAVAVAAVFGRTTTTKRQLRTATGNPSTLCRTKEKSQVPVEGARLESTLCATIFQSTIIINSRLSIVDFK